MKLIDQVCTLEQGQKLELLLGEDIKSSLYWVDYDGWHVAQPCNKGFCTVDDAGEVYTESIPECFNAFTVAELGIMLPERFSSTKKAKQTWRSQYWWDGFLNKILRNANLPDCRWKQTEGIKEAHSRADLLIYLLENSLVTADEVKQRLLAS